MPEVTGDPQRAAEVLRRGGLVALPTETVYGLAALARDAVAVGRIFTVKGRPSDHPLIVHLPDASHLGAWAEDIPGPAGIAAEAFWPGPLTMVLPARPDVSRVVTGGLETVAVRVPAHPLTREVLAILDEAVAAPSANRFGSVSPTRAEHVVADLGDDVEVVLDGGPCEVGVESTILDMASDPPRILRPGGLSAEEISEVIGVAVVGGPGPESPARAPGMLASHYAPEARVRLADGAGALAAAVEELSRTGLNRIGLLGPTALSAEDQAVLEGLGPELLELEPAGEPEEFARVLYDRLRQADRLGLAAVVVIPPAGEGIAVAVRDRLRRAANDG